MGAKRYNYICDLKKLNRKQKYLEPFDACNIRVTHLIYLNSITHVSNTKVPRINEMIVKQILLTLQNVWRAVWGICILVRV